MRRFIGDFLSSNRAFLLRHNLLELEKVHPVVEQGAEVSMSVNVGGSGGIDIDGDGDVVLAEKVGIGSTEPEETASVQKNKRSYFKIETLFTSN